MYTEFNDDFASLQNMIIDSKMINHKDIHKMTRKSPDGKVFNQIDHLMIGARRPSI